MVPSKVPLGTEKVTVPVGDAAHASTGTTTVPPVPVPLPPPEPGPDPPDLEPPAPPPDPPAGPFPPTRLRVHHRPNQSQVRRRPSRSQVRCHLTQSQARRRPYLRLKACRRWYSLARGSSPPRRTPDPNTGTKTEDDVFSLKLETPWEGHSAPEGWERPVPGRPALEGGDRDSSPSRSL